MLLDPDIPTLGWVRNENNIVIIASKHSLLKKWYLQESKPGISDVSQLHEKVSTPFSKCGCFRCKFCVNSQASWVLRYAEFPEDT